MSGDKKFIDDLDSCFAFMDNVESTVDQMLMITEKKNINILTKTLLMEKVLLLYLSTHWKMVK